MDIDGFPKKITIQKIKRGLPEKQLTKSFSIRQFKQIVENR